MNPLIFYCVVNIDPFVNSTDCLYIDAYDYAINFISAQPPFCK